MRHLPRQCFSLRRRLSPISPKKKSPLRLAPPAWVRITREWATPPEEGARRGGMSAAGKYEAGRARTSTCGPRGRVLAALGGKGFWENNIFLLKNVLSS